MGVEGAGHARKANVAFPAFLSAFYGQRADETRPGRAARSSKGPCSAWPNATTSERFGSTSAQNTRGVWFMRSWTCVLWTVTLTLSSEGVACGLSV